MVPGSVAGALDRGAVALPSVDINAVRQVRLVRFRVAGAGSDLSDSMEPHRRYPGVSWPGCTIVLVPVHYRRPNRSGRYV
jgi:hypothetical protein